MLKTLRRWYAFIAFVALLFLISGLTFPFVWIWAGWSYAWKIAVSAVAGMFVCGFLKSVLKRVMTEIDDDAPST